MKMALAVLAFLVGQAGARAQEEAIHFRPIFHEPGNQDRDLYKTIVSEVRSSPPGSVVTVSWYQLRSGGGFDEAFSKPFLAAIKEGGMTIRGNIGSSKKALPSPDIVEMFKAYGHNAGELQGVSFYGKDGNARDPGPNASYFNHDKLIAISPDKVIISSLNYTHKDRGKYGAALVVRSRGLHDSVVKAVVQQRASYDSGSKPPKTYQQMFGGTLIPGNEETFVLKYEHSPIIRRNPVSDFLENIKQGLGTETDNYKGKLVIVVPKITHAPIRRLIQSLGRRSDIEITLVARFRDNSKGKHNMPNFNPAGCPSIEAFTEKTGNKPMIHGKYLAYSGSWGAAKVHADVLLHGTANFTSGAWERQQESTLQIVGAPDVTRQFMEFADVVRGRRVSPRR